MFHLDGRGAVADLELPALAWLRAAPEAAPIPVIVVQAEALPDGQRRYGLLGADRIVEVGAEQVEGLQPWLDPSKRRAAAERFLACAAANDLEGVRALLAPDGLAELEAAGRLEAMVERLRGWTAEQLAGSFFPSRDGAYRYRVR